MGILKWSCCLNECVVTWDSIVVEGKDVHVFHLFYPMAPGAHLAKMFTPYLSVRAKVLSFVQDLKTLKLIFGH